MKYLFMGNNWTAWQVLDRLQRSGDPPAGLVTHPPERQLYGAELLAAADLDPSHIFAGSQLKAPAVREAIRDCGAEIGVSVLFGYLLDPEFIEMFPRGVINLHPSYLPYNRGAFPNVWSIVDQTPAGVTLHYIDAGVDTGDIIAQRQVEVDETDTGQSLYAKLAATGVSLFLETWPHIKNGTAPRMPQNGAGTHYKKVDVESIDRIELDHQYTAREFIDRLRARTFPPHRGAYFEKDGRRIYLRLELEEQQETKP